MIELWSLSLNPKLRDNNIWSADQHHGYWNANFGKMHGKKLWHEHVFWVLDDIRYTANLREEQFSTDCMYPEFSHKRSIQWIYEPAHWMGSDSVDFITPILHQMQADIIAAMLEDDELVLYLMRGMQREDLARNTRVLFENYYAHGIIRVQSMDEAGIWKADDNSPFDRRLKLIERLILRGSTEGERSAAQNLYKRISGHDYVQQ